MNRSIRFYSDALQECLKDLNVVGTNSSEDAATPSVLNEDLPRTVSTDAFIKRMYRTNILLSSAKPTPEMIKEKEPNIERVALGTKQKFFISLKPLNFISPDIYCFGILSFTAEFASQFVYGIGLAVLKCGVVYNKSKNALQFAYEQDVQPRCSSYHPHCMHVRLSVLIFWLLYYFIVVASSWENCHF